jgi:ABC-type transport system involved in multi-copper enzyme maturation permease subunit
MFDDEVTRSQNSASLFVAFFTVTLVDFWAVIVGSYVGSCEYRHNTVSLHTVDTGRYRGTICKALVLLIIVIVNIVFGYCFGFITSILLFGANVAGFSLGLTLWQLLVSFLVAASISLFSMMIAKIFKNFIVSAILIMLVLFGVLFVPQGFNDIVYILSPYAYVSSNIETVFSNVVHLKSFSLSNFSWIPYWLGYSLLTIGSASFIIIQLLVKKFEQFER